MVPLATLLSIVSCLFASRIQAFAPPRTIVTTANNRHYGATSTSLSLSSPIPTGDRPPPRRTLKKRKNKRRQRMDEQSKNIRGLNSNTHNSNNFHNREISSLGLLDDNDDDVEIEIRPIRKRKAIEAGLDYWIDDGDLKREKIRKKAVKNRKAMEGEISKEKLREEVVAPYKQNWIGIFSVVIVMLSAIGTTFPELLQVPVIPIPDL